MKMTELLFAIRRLRQSCTVLAVIAFVLPSYAHAGLALTFESEVLLQPKSESDSAPTNTQSELSVLLGDSYFQFSGAEEGIYDFDKRVIYSINRGKGIYSTMSLFANVGFRGYELQNRKFLSGALENAGVENNPMSLVFSEHELSVQAKDSKPAISREERNGQIVFLESGKEMLKIGGPVIEIPEKYQKQFIRFFRHRYGGHPSIINEIITSSGIYKDITIWQVNIGEKKIHLHLKSVEETPPANYSLKGLEKYTEAKNRLMKLVGRIGDTPMAKREETERKILANASHLIDKNDLVGAMLAYLEYTLVTGSQVIPWTETNRVLLLNSDDVKNMLATTRNPTNREEAASLISALESLRKKQITGNHILKIFEANTRASMGESTIARDFMMDALETNPYIASAWKDLGGYYFQSYEPYEAWVCWGTARTINTSHPLLDGITDFENRLLVEHPGLF